VGDRHVTGHGGRGPFGFRKGATSDHDAVAGGGRAAAVASPTPLLPPVTMISTRRSSDVFRALAQAIRINSPMARAYAADMRGRPTAVVRSITALSKLLETKADGSGGWIETWSSTTPHLVFDGFPDMFSMFPTV
jgi:hypothetical protein